MARPKKTTTTKAAEKPVVTPTPASTATDWRDPDFKPADDDQGLEARMWRLAQRTPTK